MTNVYAVVTDIARPSGSAAAAAVPASETKEHPTSTELEDGEGCRGEGLLLPHCDEVE